MTTLKLTYFELPISRGEECRLALAISGIDFVDNRINREQWEAQKSAAPFLKMPLLEEEGRPVLSESNAILTLIGRRYGLLPTHDDWETARHESILSACEAFRHAVTRTFGISDPEELKRVRGELVAGPLLAWGGNIERQIQGPFVGGEKLSVADIKIYIMVGWIQKGVLDHIPTDALAHFPKLQALCEGVKSHPAVVAWYAREH